MVKLRGTSDYQQMLIELLPLGLAWNKNPDSNLGQLLLAEATSLASVENEAFRLISEANPTTTKEALSDWEKVVGLPDACSSLEETFQKRRAAVLWKLRRPVGQSKEFFIQQAELLGCEIEIEEYPLFQADLSHADDRCYQYPAGQMNTENPDYYQGWLFVWGVISKTLFIENFRADLSLAGDYLRVWGNQELTCRLKKIKPAHTFILFIFEGV